MSIRITHVRFADGVRDHPHISAVKWVDLQSGETNSSTKAVIVDWIDNKNGKAYVGTGASQVQIGTVHPSGATPYLRTYADGQWTNNLVSLPSSEPTPRWRDRETEGLMSSTFYTGGRVRPIQLQDYPDVVEAAAAGSLDETQWVELKEMLPPAKSENLEVAKDLASLAVGGGVLLVGVRDAKGSAGEVVGTKLERLADRVSQVAVTRIDPPLNVVVREVPDPERDGYGVLVVTVPASLSAPHMVDGAYWGRHARGKRKMSDGEVRLLHHEGERRAASFVQDLQALPADLCTVTDSNRRLAHVYLLMRPEVSVGTALADAIADGRSFRSFVDDGLRFNPRYLPTLDGAVRSVPNPDGWELSTGTDAEDLALRAVLGTDGSLAVYTGHLSYETDSDHERRRYISPGTAIELTHSTLEVAGHIGAKVLHYQGTWQIGVLADGLLGLPSTLARSASRTRIAAYPRDRFENVIQATTDDLLGRTREVVGELLRPFMRGMGAEFLLEYPSPDKIGDQLSR